MNAHTVKYISESRKTEHFVRSCKGFIATLFFLIMLPIAPAFPALIEGVPELRPGMIASTDPVFYDSVSVGIKMVLNDRFEEALRWFDNLQHKHPDHPAPYFFRAAVYQTWMSFFWLNKFRQDFEENVQLAIEKGEALLERKNDPWLYFYVGAAYGYRAFNGFRKNEWISAYFDAKKGINHFEEALTRDPNMFDVYLGLGAYHYWRTAKSNFIRIIAFWIPDKRELGLRQLEFSFKHGTYASEQAGYNLVAAYFDYGKYEKAMEILNLVTQKKVAPSITDLYYRGRLLIKFEKWGEVESTFREIVKHLENYDVASVGYQVECKYWIAEALAAQNKRSKALEMTEVALAESKKREAEAELEGPFENFGEIHARLEGLKIFLKGEKPEYFRDRDLPAGWSTR